MILLYFLPVPLSSSSITWKQVNMCCIDEGQPQVFIGVEFAQ